MQIISIDILLQEGQEGDQFKADPTAAQILSISCPPESDALVQGG